MSHVLLMSDGLAYATLTAGVLGTLALAALRRQLSVSVRALPQPQGYVLDVTAPAWMVGDAGLDGLLDGADSALPEDAPVAIITTTATEELFRRYTWRMAQAGLMRKVFSAGGSSQAAEWTRLRALLMAQGQTVR